GRAEVTRLFKFGVKTGQNQVNISGLPNVLDQDSFRVEGRGAATIHDVTVSTIPQLEKPASSPKLKELERQRERITKALERAKKALESLQTYLNTLNVQHLDVTGLKKVVDNYDATGEQLDDKVSELEAKIQELNEQINAEKLKLDGPTGNEKLNLKAVIGVFADSEGEVEIALIYAVHSATWSAGYDIRVDMQTKEKPITLIYKGAITQSTGEDWDDVPLTLETATPTFGLGVPTLDPWTLSIYRPPVYKGKMKNSLGFGGGGAPQAQLIWSPPESWTYSAGPSSGAVYESDASSIQHRGLHVSSKGNISATFGVPGMISIPSDNVAHNVTIVKLQLDATMSWVSVPKKDAKTHLNAKVKNASEYTLLPGTASVYVDGSFISRSDVPSVSPDESFDCPLGLDPSIRITYHPRVKKVSQSGFYTKSSNYIFTQRVTVFNTKSTSIENLKIIDQLPVSEDALITVKLVSPALVLPSAESSGTTKGSGVPKVPPPVKVATGVEAQWDGLEEVGDDIENLGRDGKFNWLCAIPAQGKNNLQLQWEVTAPVRTDITGL
ncbi:hypothetical protein BDQ12DRAFT_307927, partial [Crucibulum laeve]